MKVAAVLMLLTFLEVKCDCGDVFSCFNDVVLNLFGVKSNETVNVSDNVNYTLINLDSETDLKKTFQAVADEYKNSIQNITEIVSESQIFRRSDNNTKVLVKTINLGNTRNNKSTFKQLKTNKHLNITNITLNLVENSVKPKQEMQEATASKSLSINEYLEPVDNYNPTQKTKATIDPSQLQNYKLENANTDTFPKNVNVTISGSNASAATYIPKHNETTTVTSKQYSNQDTNSDIDVNKTVTEMFRKTAILDNVTNVMDIILKMNSTTMETEYTSEDLLARTESMSSVPLFTEETTISYRELDSYTEQDRTTENTQKEQRKSNLPDSSTTLKPHQKEPRRMKSSKQGMGNNTKTLQAQAKTLKSELEEALDNKRNEISEYTDEYPVYTDGEAGDYLDLDYVNYYEDTTNEDVSYTTEAVEVKQKPVAQTAVENSTSNGNCHSRGATGSVSAAIFPPIAAIFIKNGTENQFEYVCDGAILSSMQILTAARCISTDNGTRDVDDVIVIAGKRSLVDMGDNQAIRVVRIKLHANFTTGNFTNGESRIENDLAAITLESDVTLNDRVQTACLYDGLDKNVTDASTTGWQLSGALVPIQLVNNPQTCAAPSPRVFCDSYGYGVSTCPSRGGLYFVKLTNNLWYLKGVLSQDTASRGICVDRTLKYTDVTMYMDWIKSL